MADTAKTTILHALPTSALTCFALPPFVLFVHNVHRTRISAYIFIKLFFIHTYTKIYTFGTDKCNDRVARMSEMKVNKLKLPTVASSKQETETNIPPPTRSFNRSVKQQNV